MTAPDVLARRLEARLAGAVLGPAALELTAYDRRRVAMLDALELAWRTGALLLGAAPAGGEAEGFARDTLRAQAVSVLRGQADTADLDALARVGRALREAEADQLAARAELVATLARVGPDLLDALAGLAGQAVRERPEDPAGEELERHRRAGAMFDALALALRLFAPDDDQGESTETSQ